MAYDFEKLKKNVTNTGKELGTMARDVADQTKLKIDIKSKERELDQLYAALGRVYYTNHQTDEDIPEAVMFRGIRKAEEELFLLKKEAKNR